MARKTHLFARIGLAALALAAQIGCTETISKTSTDPLAAGIGPEQSLPPEARKIIEEARARASRPMIDAAAPEVFQATELAMWDGKPTFGDVWIAVPGIDQPERVEIRNEETGKIVRAAMLVADEAPGADAQVRLSAGAAEALGVGPLQEVRITVTAMRMSPVHEEASVRLPRSSAGPTRTAPMDLAELLAPSPLPYEPGPAPSLDPAPVETDFVEVAQAFDPDEANRVFAGLQAHSIHAEIQEDRLDGGNLFRVFASTRTTADALFAALDDIRYANGAEGSETGTLIAELPDFLDVKTEEEPDWVEIGTFTSRNEAMSVVQKLSRTHVPTEICDQRQGLLTMFRVFAGPSDSEATIVDPAIRGQLTAAFCSGVAAMAAATPQDTRPVAAPPLVVAEPEPIPDAFTTGAVRIKVGEATGGLKITVPNPYSAPVLIPVRDVLVSVPQDASPELVEAIRAALEPLR